MRSCVCVFSCENSHVTITLYLTLNVRTGRASECGLKVPHAHAQNTERRHIYFFLAADFFLAGDFFLAAGFLAAGFLAAAGFFLVGDFFLAAAGFLAMVFLTAGFLAFLAAAGFCNKGHGGPTSAQADVARGRCPVARMHKGGRRIVRGRAG